MADPLADDLFEDFDFQATAPPVDIFSESSLLPTTSILSLAAALPLPIEPPPAPVRKNADQAPPLASRASGSDAVPTSTTPELDEVDPVRTIFLPASSPALLQSNAFAELFESKLWLEKLRNLALSGKFSITPEVQDASTALTCAPFRSIAWRLFMKVLPPHETPTVWLEQTRAQRRRYQELLAEHYQINPHAASEDDDPLSQNESSVWHKYFKNSQLEEVIRTDVIRTYPEVEFFQSEEIRRQLIEPLFVYSSINPRLSYRQGMHELLAPIVYLFHRHAVQDPAPTDVAGQLCDAQFIVHDAFWLFNAIMEQAADFFLSHSASSPAVAAGGGPVGDGQAVVIQKCKYIQNTLLKKFDPQLEQYLTDLNVLPHLYGLRWVRILLGREFHLEDLLTIWDGLFAYDASLSLLDYICVAMLIYIRGHILQHEYADVLKRLFKFPPVEHVLIFIERAIELKDGPKAQKPQQSAPLDDTVLAIEPQPAPAPSLLEPRPPKPAAPPAAKSLPPLASLVGLAHPKGASKKVAPPSASELASRVSTLEQEVTKLQTTQKHMASRLERIIFVLQQELFLKSEGERDNDLLLLALAELKQVKDIGFGEIFIANSLDMLPEPPARQ
jgi:hypothetical protein